MRRTLMLAVLLLGCGAAASATAPSRNAEPAAAPIEVVARLGCDEVTREQLDRFIAEDLGLRLDGERDPDAALTLLLRGLAVARLARELDVEVDEAGVDQAIALLAEARNLTVDGLYLALDDQHIDRMSYRRVVREHLVSLRVANLLWGAGYWPQEPGPDVDVSAALEGSLARYVELLGAVPIEHTQDGCVELGEAIGP